MGLHADRVDDEIAAPPACQLAHGGGDVVVLTRVEYLDPVPPRHLPPFGDVVDANHPRALVAGDPRAELPDRPQPEHGHAAPGRDVGVVDRLPRRGQDVGQVQETPVRDLDRPEVRHRDPQELRLFRDRRWQVRIARPAQELLLEMRTATEELTHELGRDPADPELAVRLGVSPEELRDARQAASGRSALSLDAPAGDSEDSAELSELIGDDDDSIGHADGMTAV